MTLKIGYQNVWCFIYFICFICFICSIIVSAFLIYFIVNFIESKYINKYTVHDKANFEDIPQTNQTSIPSYQMSQKDIENSLQPLKIILDKYSNLDIPISITNYNTICNPWGIFQNNKFLTRDNVCLVVNRSGDSSTDNIRQCLSGASNQLTPCDKFYKNGTINNANIILTDNFMNNALGKLKNGMNTISSLITQKANELTNNINNVVRYKKILMQQLSLIDKNDTALEDKRKINDNKNIEMDIKANQTGINYDKFNQYLDNNNTIRKQLELYKKIIYVLIFILIIILLINYLISKTL